MSTSQTSGHQISLSLGNSPIRDGNLEPVLVENQFPVGCVPWLSPDTFARRRDMHALFPCCQLSVFVTTFSKYSDPSVDFLFYKKPTTINLVTFSGVIVDFDVKVWITQ